MTIGIDKIDRNLTTLHNVSISECTIIIKIQQHSQ